MNTPNIEMLLIGMVVSTFLTALFIYVASLFVRFLEAASRREHKNGGRNLKASEPAKRRRRIETRANIICSLPIHQEVRPEAPLS